MCGRYTRYLTWSEIHLYRLTPGAHGVRSMITARGHLVEVRVRLDNMIRGVVRHLRL